MKAIMAVAGVAMAGLLTAMISQLEELTEVQLYLAIFLMGGFFGVAGKLVRAQPEEHWMKAWIVGQAMALLGVLGGRFLDQPAGRDTLVFIALLLAMLGSGGAQIVMKRAAGYMHGGKTDE